MSEQSIAVTGRMLGAMLYYSPDAEQVAALSTALADEGWQTEWPLGQRDKVAEAALQVQQGLQPQQKTALLEEYQRLFIGPHALPAPPWGSVYLDRESVLFGDSTLALRQWMRTQGIQPLQQQREPEDQLGMMLMLAAWVAENQPQQLDELLTDHLLPWVPRCLELLAADTRHPFYQGLVQLTRLTLEGWQEQRGLSAVRKELFR